MTTTEANTALIIADVRHLLLNAAENIDIVALVEVPTLAAVQAATSSAVSARIDAAGRDIIYGVYPLITNGAAEELTHRLD